MHPAWLLLLPLALAALAWRRSARQADALARELTERDLRLAAQGSQVASQQRLLEVALGALAEGVACIDRIDRIAYANTAFLRLATGAESPVTGDSFYRHLPHEAVSAAVARVRTGKEAGTIPPFDHRRHHLVATVLAGGDVTILVLHDRTDMERLETARRDFLASVSHELKTPLTAIQGAADVLADGAVEDPEAARPFVATISRQAERLTTLVSDVLTLSRLEAGAWANHPVAVDLTVLVREVVEHHRPAAEARPVTLEVQVPEHAPAHLDPELLHHGLGNLVSNAIRYNRPGGRVTIRLEIQEGRTVLMVADTGIGIPPEHQARIFERFYRIDAHRSRATGGTGLGLAIVRELVATMGGTIAMVSGPTGSTFTLTLPLAAPVGP